MYVFCASFVNQFLFISEHQFQFPVIPKREIPSEDEVVTSISQSHQPSNKENMKSADTAQEEIVATQ